MIEHEQFLKLKKQAMIYCPYRTSVAITEDFQHYCDFQSDQVHIHLGKKAPYRYAKKLHPEGYELFLEGLNIQLIAYKLRFDQLDLSLPIHEFVIKD